MYTHHKHADLDRTPGHLYHAPSILSRSPPLATLMISTPRRHWASREALTISLVSSFWAHVRMRMSASAARLPKSPQVPRWSSKSSAGWLPSQGLRRTARSSAPKGFSLQRGLVMR